MTKFKGGDRVAVYNNGKRIVGVVKHIECDGTLGVSGVSPPIHPKQCRLWSPKYKTTLKPKTETLEWPNGSKVKFTSDNQPDYGPAENFYRCPFGQPGDRLWVRETWARFCRGNSCPCKDPPAYRASFEGDLPAWTKWRPSPEARICVSEHLYTSERDAKAEFGEAFVCLALAIEVSE